jgi:4,5-dihydroxyphthalate decarboxylase
MRWLTHDGAHVEEFQDPPCVEPAPKGKSLQDMLRDGDIDAAIFGNDLPQGDEFAPVIPDAAAKDRAWYDKHHFMPINHMVAVGRDTARKHPAAVAAAYRLLVEAAAAVPNPSGEPSRTRFGLESLRDPIRFTIETCERQKLLPRKLTVDDVFGEAARILGDAGR